MAVYERSYRSYAGSLTPEKSRFLVLPRYAYEEVFRSKLFVAFLVGCMVWPLVLSLIIYLPHNLSFLKKFALQSSDLLNIFQYDAAFFLQWFMIPHGFLSFLVALVLGPALISADMRNNGLPLYFSRPFSRFEYVLGKTAILIILLSAVTWLPGLWLFALHSYLMGMEWFAENFTIGISIFLASWIWILILCLLSLAVSAYVKWKPVARLVLCLIWFVLAPIGEMANALFDTYWGSLINLSHMIGVVWARLFGVVLDDGVPLAAAWASLLAACAICVMLLGRKVRAYEVVKS